MEPSINHHATRTGDGPSERFRVQSIKMFGKSGLVTCLRMAVQAGRVVSGGIQNKNGGYLGGVPAILIHHNLDFTRKSRRSRTTWWCRQPSCPCPYHPFCPCPF